MEFNLFVSIVFGVRVALTNFRTPYGQSVEFCVISFLGLPLILDPFSEVSSYGSINILYFYM
jgi:hypothetical protein